MDPLDRSGRRSDDGRATERERVRLEDKLRQLDAVAADALVYADQHKHRYGYSWASTADKAGLRMTAAAAYIDDAELTAAIDQLRAITSPHEGRAPTDQLEAGYRGVVARLGQIRRDVFEDRA